MKNLEHLNSSIIRYNLLHNQFDANQLGWKISKSRISGKGIVATKRYEPGDVIFVDYPLVVGPKNVPDQTPMCVVCCKAEDLKLCSGGCELTVCSYECENNAVHDFECRYLRKLNLTKGTRISQLVRVLTPVRCLQFDQLEREIVNCLYKLKGPSHGLEVRLLKNLSSGKIPVADEQFMYTCCYVLDANAYEVQNTTNSTLSIRGLYPMASVLNHSCCPNTTHTFTDKYEMLVKATNVINPGTEITSTYSPLLMGTVARRHFLHISKNFYCSCSRCEDPTELGTFLSALKCRTKSCFGNLLPINPLNVHSEWKCDFCNVQLSPSKISVLQNVLAQSLSKMDPKLPTDILDFVNDNHVASKTHHTIMQFKYILLKLIGYADGYLWHELSVELLNIKKNICFELLEIVKKLSLGQCQIKGVHIIQIIETGHNYNTVYTEHNAAYTKDDLISGY